MTNTEPRDREAIAAYLAKCAAVVRFERALRAALQPDRAVTYEHAQHLRHVIVEEQSSDRVKVRNDDTGCSYWLYCTRIREVMP
jgi:hypothetical protein